MIKTIVAGAAGRMGKRIIQMIQENEGILLHAAFEHPAHPQINEDAGTVAGMGALGVRIKGSLEEVIDGGDVLIDFTTPRCTHENIQMASTRGLSMVIGTTGISGDMLKVVENCARRIRCVLSPNMSVGINVMLNVVGEIAKVLGDDYDMEILEIHHRFKKDAPSGTAMRLAQVLANATRRDLNAVGKYKRKGMIGERSKEEIGIQTLRGGDITGEHTVMFAGIGETLELNHRAHNRDNFAKGAIRAAKWVVRQPIGLYDMQDVLGLGKRR